MASNEKYENETTSIWYDHPQITCGFASGRTFHEAIVPHIDNETTRGQPQMAVRSDSKPRRQPWMWFEKGHGHGSKAPKKGLGLDLFFDCSLISFNGEHMGKSWNIIINYFWSWNSGRFLTWSLSSEMDGNGWDSQSFGQFQDVL